MRLLQLQIQVLPSEKIVLGGDEYFVLGDNRESSEDSRMADIGNVKRSEIEGKVWFILSPKDRFGLLVNRRRKLMNFNGIRAYDKGQKMMQENIKLIDLVIELVDARVPMSSRNPDIDELGKNKARLILLNKADLADEKQTEEWIGYSAEKDIRQLRLIPVKAVGLSLFRE